MNIGAITKVAKAIAQKAGSRKLAVTAAVGAAAATGATEVTWPMAAVAIAYIISQAVVDVADGR
jgi:H+/Cl- antiporter ClcA